MSDLEAGIEAIRSRIPDAWGKWVGGPQRWWPILVRLNEEISALEPDYEVHQVKEKFGGLRYYIGDVSDVNYATVAALIQKAEQEVDDLEISLRAEEKS